VLCIGCCCFRTYNAAAAAGPVTDSLHISNDHCTATAHIVDDGGYYQFPLPVGHIYWVDCSDVFHISVDHIAQVTAYLYSTLIIGVFNNNINDHIMAIYLGQPVLAGTIS